MAPAGVPGFVLEYAPVLYLHSEDPYFPSDIGQQIANTVPQVDFESVNDAPASLSLENLSDLNNVEGTVFLTTTENIENNPAWLNGVRPNEDGKTEGAVTSTIVVNDHGDGTVDAFYFHFYAYDYSGEYFGIPIGNHVGDWEHNMVRFEEGQPQAVWYSQHANGQAFHYETVEKYNDGPRVCFKSSLGKRNSQTNTSRPVAYAANGSHAVYGTDGTHAYGIPNINLPWGPVSDETDHGPFWDPTLSAYYYSYDAETSTFTPYDDNTPVDYLYFDGHWGDDRYPEDDPRQEGIFGIDGLWKYTNGPTGPIDKDLNREDVCPDNGELCIVRYFLVP